MKKMIAYLLCMVSVLHATGREDFLKDQVCSVLPSLEGWCSQEKALEFVDLVLEIEPSFCVEIGVFGGSSLFPVAAALKFLGKGVVVGVDPWEKGECVKHLDPLNNRTDFVWWNNLNLEYVYDSYISMLRRFGLGEYCITMKATSGRAAICFQSIDLLHLAGSLSEKVSIEDVKLYLPKVRSGGYIWLNDAICPQRQIPSEMPLEESELIKSIDNGKCILFKKR